MISLNSIGEMGKSMCPVLEEGNLGYLVDRGDPVGEGLASCSSGTYGGAMLSANSLRIFKGGGILRGFSLVRNALAFCHISLMVFCWLMELQKFRQDSLLIFFVIRRASAASL